MIQAEFSILAGQRSEGGLLLLQKPLGKKRADNTATLPCLAYKQ
jgi:hypothetical protein